MPGDARGPADGRQSRVDSLSPDRRELLNRLLLGAREPAPTSIPRRSPSEKARLSFAQQRLWILDRLTPGNPLYNETNLLPLPFAIDAPVVERVVNEIVRRHEILRTTIRGGDGEPEQVIAPALHLTVPAIDLRHLQDAGCDRELSRLAVEDAHRPFDLATGPLLRVTLVRLRDDDCSLLLTMHHIVCDGWSIALFALEFAWLYSAFAQGLPSPLPELALQYADFSLWQRQALSDEVLAPQLAYWKRQLAGISPLELPADRARPRVSSFRGVRREVNIDPVLHRDLQRLSEREDATLFMTVLAAFVVLLHRYSNHRDIAVGVPIAGRNRSELEGLIGFFVNTLVLRTDLSGEPTFREALQRIRAVALQAYAHQDVPFELLVSKLQPERDAGRNPLFQAMFQLFTLPGAAGARPDPVKPARWIDPGFAKFDLRLDFVEAAGTLSGYFEYSTDLFDAETIERMAGHFQVLLAGIVADPDRPIAALPLMGEGERQRVLEEWNATTTAYPREHSVAALVAAQAQRAPAAVAVREAGATLTYGELDRQANQLAQALRAGGVAPGARVAVCLDRSTTCIRALLAVWKAGAVYVPLDPGYPPARLGFMLQDVDAAVVLTTTALRSRLPAGGVPVICVDTDQAGGETPLETPLPAATGASLAYIMYTSGSTGQPKGVAVPHRAIVRLVQATNYITLTAADRVAHAASVAFDAATFEIWGALANGAQVVIVPTPVALEARALAAYLRQEQVTALFVTTDLFHQLVGAQPDVFASLDTLLFGGAAIDPTRVRTVLQQGAPRRLVHVYGPTETTTFATWHLVDAVPAAAVTVPIGQPISNTQAYVLDPHGAPVPIGVPGELFLGGDGLADGYAAHPALTAERFVPAPGSAVPGSRVYRTGDRVRRRGDGALEFLGRVDDQVKLRGFRVEPGEVEAVLRRHPLVREAVVAAREYASGDIRLVAYVVPADTPPSPDTTARHAAPGQRPISQEQVASLRDFLAGHLPEYMLPAAFALMDAFPLVNGKIERSALPLPDAAGSVLPGTAFTPATALENVMCAIWKELLYVDEIDAGRDFFELGGHSLLAMQLVSRVRDALQVELPVRKVFESPTLAALCRALLEHAPDGARLEKTAELLLLVDAIHEQAAVDMLGSMNQPRRAS